MAVPKRKTSKSRRNMRNRQNSKIQLPALSFCKECKGPTKPHFACKSCGFYNGRFLSI
jgi:large subunit ribosomal protein L32